VSVRKIVPIEQAEWRIEPAPAWAEVREPDWTFTPPEGHAVAVLLIDEQHHVASQATTWRNVRQILTHAAVQAMGQVSLEFDPAAHRLLIHEVARWRRGADGTWTKRSFANREAFMLRQREQRMEEQMLNGQLSVVALLEDVRVGDAIDLSWTVEPRDALPGLKFTTFFAFVWAAPVAHAAFTLHLSKEHPIRWHMHAPEGMARPVEELAEGRATWSVKRPAVFQPENNVPGDHWAFPLLEVTGWTTWPQVARFFAELWADAMTDDPAAIQEEAARLREGRDLPSAVGAAIRFVQEEVRYLAVDFGHGAGMLPNAAGTVLRRRFGDCKDKTVLLVALLRALGVEAWPLLVAPNWREAVGRMQPSPSCFSHVIVAFTVDGKRHFTDPTVVGQGGDLARLVAPPYGCGLEVRPEAEGLLTLPALPPAELTVTETFDLDRKQKDGAVEQVLHATGWLADELRAAVVQQGKAAFFKGRAEGLQRHFPAMVISETSDAGAEIIDDNAANVIEARARHPLPTWGPTGTKPPPMFRYGAHGLFYGVEIIDGAEQRRQPWALRFPMKVHHRVVVRGKCVQRLKDENFRIEGPGFRYSCDVKGRRKEATFDYRWETTQREIPPEKWGDYRRERDRAFERAGANVVTGGGAGAWGNALWVGAILFIVFCVVMGVNEKERKRDQHVEIERPHNPSVTAQKQMERDVRNAFDAARRGDFRAAEPTLERVKANYTGNFEFQVLRAEVSVRTGHLDRAQEALDVARKLGSTPVQPDLVEAHLREALGDLPGARKILEAIRTRAPGEASALFDLARLAERMGDVAAARDRWGELLALRPGHPDTLLRYATLLWRTGDKEKADALIPAAIRAQPTPSPILESTLAQYYTFTSRHAEAVPPAQRALVMSPDDPMLAYRYAMVLARSGDKAAALAAARQMSTRFPQSALAWNAFATTSATAGDMETAGSAFRKWVELAPNDGEALLGYGYYLHRTGQLAEARKVLAKATRVAPGNGLAWLNYAGVLEALGESTAAAEARKKADALLTEEQRATILR